MMMKALIYFNLFYDVTLWGGGYTCVPKEINSSVQKRAKNREKSTSGDYYVIYKLSGKWIR